MKRTIIITIAMMCMTILITATSYAEGIPSSPLRKAIREYVEANMPWTPGTARVDFLSEEPEPTLQDRNITIRIESAGNMDFIGDMVFLVKFFKSGNLIKTESVRTKIEILRDVVIAARTLLPGTILTENDVRKVRKWVRRVHPQSLSPFETIVGKHLKTHVASGMEILSSMLKDIPLVRKGKMVKIVFDNGLMHIVTVGLSEEDGVAGNIIRVRNIESNKIIYTRVLSDSLVGIEF